MIVNLYEVVNSYRHVNPSLVEQTRDISPALDAESVVDDKKYDLFSDVYVFGDSISDIGNAFDITKKINGEGLPPAPPYFREHFSNGPVWVEYLTQLLGLASKRENNFAVGGANTDGNNTFAPQNPFGLPGLQQELNSFITSVDQNADPQALYIIWAGANDYLGGNITDPTEPVKNITNAVTALTEVGAKNIMVVNLPDLGKIPASRNNAERSTPLTALTKAHNSGLATALQTLSQSSIDVNIIPFDVSAVFDQILTEPKKFGFTNVTDVELEQLSKFQGYTDKFFFWDIVHFTTAAHKMLAKLALGVLAPTNAAR